MTTVGTGGSQYAYDPYGRRTKVSGSLDADFGYTGHYYHAPSSLHLAVYRAYDANKGRWLSRDPLGEQASINIYLYVANKSVNRVDSFGLCEEGAYQEDKFSAQATLDGKNPEMNTWQNMLGKAVPEAGSAAATVEKTVTAIATGMTSTGATFNIWLKLEYSCCDCKSEWKKQAPISNKTMPDDNGSPAPEYKVNWPNLGTQMTNDVTATSQEMRQQAKEKCQQQKQK